MKRSISLLVFIGFSAIGVFALLCPKAFAAATYVTSGFLRSNTTHVSLTTASINAGDLVVVGVGEESNTTNTFTVGDNRGDSYANKIFKTGNSNAIGVWSGIAGTTGTVTITVTSTVSGQMYLTYVVMSGVSALDTIASGTTKNTSISLSQASEGIFAFGDMIGSSKSSNMTNIGQDSWNNYWTSWYTTSFGSGSQTVSVSSTPFMIVAAAFEPPPPPNTPFQELPINGAQDLTVTPSFTVTSTDSVSDPVQFSITIYSGASCSGSVVQTDDETSSETGWSDQDADSGTAYNSNSPATYTVQSALAGNAQYSWVANAIDPLGSPWSATSSCESFYTTYGNWTTDAGSWAASSNQLSTTPGTGITAQLHATGLSQSNYILDFQAKSSVGGSFSEYRDSFSGGTPTALLTGLSVSGSSVLTGGSLGFTASSTVGVTYTFDDFAAYSGTTITMNGLSAGFSWSARTSASSVISCQTGSTWNLSSYSGQVPIDYDNGGGTVAVWTNGSCSGAPDEVYPSSGLATDTYGGDVYTYTESSPGTPGSSGGSVVATSTITVSSAGAISD